MEEQLTSKEDDLKPCPLCGGEMSWKENRWTKSPFMSCNRWPDCVGTRTKDGVSSVISAAARQHRTWAIVKAAVLASEDECLTFTEQQLADADLHELHIDEITEEKSYVVTVKRKPV